MFRRGVGGVGDGGWVLGLEFGLFGSDDGLFAASQRVSSCLAPVVRPTRGIGRWQFEEGFEMVLVMKIKVEWTYQKIVFGVLKDHVDRFIFQYDLPQSD